MTPRFQDIRKSATAVEGDIVRFLMDLVRTPSFSTTERDVIAVIDREMQALGFDEVRVDGLGNIIGRIGSGPRVIAFDAHVDTVLAGDLSQWSFHPFSPKVVDGRVWGRGTVDQKGGLAAMIYAGQLIRELRLNRQFTIYFTGTVMEEDCDGLCWQYLIREEGLRPEFVVLTEPTNLSIHRGQRGRMEIAVRVSGVSCHGSAPERGENAIYKLSRIALEIENLNERLPSDPVLGKGTVTVTNVTSTAPSLCSVPDGARLQLDRRLTVGETKASAVAEVQEAARRAGVDDAMVEILVYDAPAYTGRRYPTEKYYPTWLTAEDSPCVRSAVKTFRDLFGREPLVDKWTFSTNGVAISGMHDIPCIGFGPGDEAHAHAPNESCPIEHLTAAAAFYAALVAHLNEGD